MLTCSATCQASSPRGGKRSELRGIAVQPVVDGARELFEVLGAEDLDAVRSTSTCRTEARAERRAARVAAAGPGLAPRRGAGLGSSPSRPPTTPARSSGGAPSSLVPTAAPGSGRRASRERGRRSAWWSTAVVASGDAVEEVARRVEHGKHPSSSGSRPDRAARPHTQPKRPRRPGRRRRRSVPSRAALLVGPRRGIGGLAPRRQSTNRVQSGRSRHSNAVCSAARKLVLL